MNFCKDCRHYVHFSGAPNNCIDIHECRQPESVKKFNLVTGDVEPAATHRPDAYENRSDKGNCGPNSWLFQPKIALGETIPEQVGPPPGSKFCKDCRFFSGGGECKHWSSAANPDLVTGEEKFRAAREMRDIPLMVDNQCGQDGQWFIHKDAPIEDDHNTIIGQIFRAAWKKHGIKGPCSFCGSPDHWRPFCPQLKPAIEAGQKASDIAAADMGSYMLKQRPMIFIKHPNPWWKRIFSK